jgi:uncharacterized membrane protein
MSVGSAAAIAAGLLLSAIGVFAIQYRNWTVPRHATVEGVQGRYFLPLAMAGAGLVPVLGNSRTARLHQALLAAIAALWFHWQSSFARL